MVEEETAKILPWPLAAAYGTESESKYDDEAESFRRAVPLSFFSFAYTSALVFKALVKTFSLPQVLLYNPYIPIARVCRERISID